MRPWLGRSRPEIVRRVVDLPAPFDPMSATSSPWLTRSETPCNARIAPYRTWTSCSSSIGVTAAIDAGSDIAALAEVGGDDGGIGPHGGRWPVGDDPAVIQDLDAVAQVHDQRDVMRDEDDRDALLVPDAPDQAQEVLRLDGVHAGVRLVEEHDIRLRRHGASDLQAALVAVGQVSGEPIAVLRDAEELK